MPIEYVNHSEREYDLMKPKINLDILKKHNKKYNKQLKIERTRLFLDYDTIYIKECLIDHVKKDIKKLKKQIKKRMDPYYDQNQRMRDFREINTVDTIIIEEIF